MSTVPFPPAEDVETHELSIYGSRTRYWVYNPQQTRTVVAVHGFRGNHLGLQYIIEGLSGYRIIIPDLPGSGESTPMTGRQHDIEGYSDFVQAFVKQLDLDQPVLLGHSFGTIVAAHVVAHQPGLFSRLILINPITVSPKHGMQAPATKLVEALYWLGDNLPEPAGLALLKSRGYSRLMSRTLARTKDQALRRRVYEHHFSDLAQPHYRQVIAQSFAASINRTVLDDAGHIKLATLVIAGDQDPIVPVSSHKKIQAALPQARIIVIPKVGHLIHLETPETAAAAIAEFLG